ncbi:MAG TPA: hypothetical protein VID29_01470 [Solirubrobacteraceae bacterium]|jgi:hypothetical protein
MVSSETQRTLVKSPPELWAELSDPDSLARHLGELGEIRIVRVEPETMIEWEGEGVSGAVDLKASGWGTKVTLTATREAPEPPVEQEPEPEPVVEPEPEPKLRFLARIFRRRRKTEPIAEPVPEPQEDAQPGIAAELAALEESMAAETTGVLTAVLDRLGAAHHRPFSRA